MAKRDIASSYNRREEPQQEAEKPSNQCPAHGCFMAASLSIDSAPFACRYHAKQPPENWQKVTAILHTHKRLLDIIAKADAMQPDEFDLLRDKGAFELEPLLKPAPGEPFKGWKIRIREFVFMAIKREIEKLQTEGKSRMDRVISEAVDAFTNGTLRKQQRQKSFQSIAEARQQREGDAA